MMKIHLERRGDGTWQADTDDDRHAIGPTAGEALIRLGYYVDETDRYRAARESDRVVLARLVGNPDAPYPPVYNQRDASKVMR